MDELEYALKRYKARLRQVDGISLAQRTLWVPLLASLTILMAGRFWPLEGLVAWSSLPILAWMLSIIGFSMLKPTPFLRVAQRVDLELGLYERLSTAYSIQAVKDMDSPKLQAFLDSLVSAQRRDALEVAHRIRTNLAFPYKWHFRRLSIAGVFLLAAIFLVVLPNPMEEVLVQRAVVEKMAQEQAMKVEQLRDELAKAEGLSLEEKQELMEKLADLSEALKSNPGDLEQALADISKVEEALRQKIDPNGSVKTSNLESLAARLQELSGMQQDPNRDQFEAASEGLEQLLNQFESLSDAQKSELSQQLAQMAAQAAQSGNIDLSQSLSSLAQAVQESDQKAAEQAAQAAQEALEQASSQMAGQQAIDQALSQLQAGRQAMSQAAQQMAQSGQGMDPGQGQAPGVGLAPAPNQGQPGSGGGTTADSLPPATSQGSASPPQGEDAAVSPGQLDEQVYAPWKAGAGTGEELFIPGQDTGQGDSQSTEGEASLPGASSQALVPYSEVFYTYLNAASQAIQQSYIPSDLMEYVKLYFSQLEPK